jgi:hemerythrin-like metal-binding protein
MNHAVAIQCLAEGGALTAALNMEHKSLEMMLQLLQDVILSGGDRRIITRILDMSIEFCEFHFAHEECFLRHHECSDLDSHSAAHQELRNNLQNIRHVLDENVALAALDTVDFMYAFRQHIDSHDKPTYEEIECRHRLNPESAMTA